jgi:tetratricopeptide (TPR) repeat protein
MPRAVLLALVLAWAVPVLAHQDVGVLEEAVAGEVTSRPRDPAALMSQALVHQVARRWDGALATLDRAAELGADPDEVGAARGRVYLDAGWPRMAKRELDRVIARRPNAWALVYERGRAWMLLGDAGAAADDFGRAVAHLPEPRPEQVFAHRDALLWLGRRDDAVRALDAGIARLGLIASLALAAVDLETELGRYDAAVSRLDRLLATNPKNEAWIARRGEILAQAGRAGEAQASFARALALIEARPNARRGARTEALARQLRAALAADRTEGTP